MTHDVAGQGPRVLGKSLLTLANVITAAAPLAADWNDSHIFNRRWPAHARFHGVTALAMTTTLSAANVWFLWSGGAEQQSATRFFAAAVPAAYWAPFFVAPLVPGTAVDDPPYPVGRIAGVPVSLLGAAATTATAIAGWLIDRRDGSAVVLRLDRACSVTRASRRGLRRRARAPRPARPSQVRPGSGPGPGSACSSS